jgi:hypothetical protein
LALNRLHARIDNLHWWTQLIGARDRKAAPRRLRGVLEPRPGPHSPDGTKMHLRPLG